MKKVLIVIDVQNDFVSGVLGSEDAQKIVPAVMKKIDEYRNRGDIVLFTRDTHGSDYMNTPEGKKLPIEHCIRGTKGWEIVDSIASGCKTIDKTTFGYMHWDDILNSLDNPTAVEMIGLDTDICVVTNALIMKTQRPEVEITVDARCCAGSTLDKHMAALAVMKSCQINVIGE